MSAVRSLLHDLGANLSSFEAAAPGAAGAAEKPAVKVSENVGCAPGFRCMSLISEFGMEHNGEYERVTTPILPPRFEQRDVWEWGCPALGNMTAEGKCKPPKPGEEASAGMCWSQDSLLVGPKTPCGSQGDKCMCVKPVGSDGSIGYGNKSREILPEFTEGDSGDYGGVEVVMGNFQVQPMPHCGDCMDLSANWEECKQCANCSYGTKVLDGRPTLACYPKDFQPPGQPFVVEEPPKAGDEYRQKDYVLLQGQEAHEQDMWVIPQYPLWDPQPHGVEKEAPEGGQIFPFQMNTEPLSNEAWVKKYHEAAPRIQALMDNIAMRLKNTWGPQAAETDCSEPLEERVVKANTARHMCKEMQTLQGTLAPGQLGAFPRKAEGQTLRCEFERKDTCLKLNCYSKDDDFSEAVSMMKRRNNECRTEMEEKAAEEAAAAAKAEKGKGKAGGKGAKVGGKAQPGEMSVKDLMKEEEAPLVEDAPAEARKEVQQAMPLLLGPPRGQHAASSLFGSGQRATGSWGGSFTSQRPLEEL
ncbi:unnamed protein product [Effrenium voratum]|nr:unnamed protein product [Effrenium voratum]